jgi:hypothetical protein
MALRGMLYGKHSVRRICPRRSAITLLSLSKFCQKFAVKSRGSALLTRRAPETLNGGHIAIHYMTGQSNRA